MALSILWFLVCAKLITPALNSGSIDYLALYDRLGASGGDILLKAITQPQRILGALFQSLARGNLVWALLLPFLVLPLIRPRWLLIATPIPPASSLSGDLRMDDFSLRSSSPPCFGSLWGKLLLGLPRCASSGPECRHSVSVIVAAVAAQILLYRQRYRRTPTIVQRKTDRAATSICHPIPPDISALAPLPSFRIWRCARTYVHYVRKAEALSR